MNSHGAHSREQGSAAIEAAIGIPAFLMFVALILLAGRTAIATQAIEAAAAQAARSASIERSEDAARVAAEQGASTSLTNQDLACITQRVDIDTSEFATPVGTPANVDATVECEVPLADLSLPGVPGSITLTSTMSSPLDTYRERGGP